MNDGGGEHKTAGPRITIFGALFATFAIAVGIWLSLTLPLVLMTLVPIAIFYSVIRRSFDDYRSNAASLCIKATLLAIASNISAGLLIVSLAFVKAQIAPSIDDEVHPEDLASGITYGILLGAGSGLFLSITMSFIYITIRLISRNR